MKALSPMISTVLLIVIAISITALVAPWMYEMVTTTTNQTGYDTQQQIKCRNAGLDFDSGYGNYGVDWNFTGNGTDWIRANVVNTGNINLWGFSFEVTLESQSGKEIRHYATIQDTALSEINPLKPSESAIIQANVTDDINGSISSLVEVKVLNAVCVLIAPSVKV